MADEGKKEDGPPKKITNPLTLIAVFAGLAETEATYILIKLSAKMQLYFVWFVMLFPLFLVGGFYFILYNKHWALYAPSDYENEGNFFSVIKTAYSTKESSSGLLEDKNNRRKIIDWMRKNSLGDESFTMFLISDVFLDQRKKMMQELGLSANP